MSITVTKEEARRIVWEDTSDFILVESSVTDTSRWSIQHEGICQHIESEKYYFIDWSVGATEMQDEGPFEYHKGDVTLTEAIQKEVKIMKWVTKK